MFNYKINLLIIGVTLFLCSLFYYQHGKNSYTFYGDALGYYCYLPGAFIYHNLNTFDSLPSDKKIEQPVLDYFNQHRQENQQRVTPVSVNQYTYGVALTELPFFLIAHAYEKRLTCRLMAIQQTIIMPSNLQLFFTPC